MLYSTSIPTVLDVIDGFDELTENESVPEEFITYFQSTYIGIFQGQRAQPKKVNTSVPCEYVEC